LQHTPIVKLGLHPVVNKQEMHSKRFDARHALVRCTLIDNSEALPFANRARCRHLQGG